MDEIKCIRKNGLLYVSALVYLEFLLLVGLCFFLKIFPRVTQLTTYYFISLVGSSSRVFGIQLLHMEFMRTAFFSVARQIQLGHSRQTPTFGFPPKKRRRHLFLFGHHQSYDFITLPLHCGRLRSNIPVL